MDVNLLFAGISTIKDYHTDDNSPLKIDIETFSKQILRKGFIGSLKENDKEYCGKSGILFVHVHHSGKSFTMPIDLNETVGEFSLSIEANQGIPLSQVRLNYWGKILLDEIKLSDYGVKHGDLVHQITRFGDNDKPCPLYLDENDLSPLYNKVYSNGWMKFALNINRYNEIDGNDNWINDKSDSSWPVAYFGLGNIDLNQYTLNSFPDHEFCKCNFLKPSFEMAENDRVNFFYQSNLYTIFYKCRVNPKTLLKMEISPTNKKEFFISKDDNDVRLYGILIKLLK